MALLKTPAIVLETRDYRETSLLVTLFTREAGRLGAVAKGARRPRSGVASALQPYSLVEAQLLTQAGGGLATLRGVDLVHHPRYAVQTTQAAEGEAFQSLARYAHAALLAEVLAANPENDPHAERLFDMARDFLTRLEAAPWPGSFALAGYLALLGELGYAPSLDADGPDDAAQHLDVVDGTLHPAHAAPSATDHLLRPRELDILRRIAANAPAVVSGQYEALTVGFRTGRHLTRLVIRLFEAQLERRLRSARFLEEMVLARGDRAP